MHAVYYVDTMYEQVRGDSLYGHTSFHLAISIVVA